MLYPKTIVEKSSIYNFINEDSSFDINFKNDEGGEIGFGPMFDIVFEKGIDVKSNFNLIATWSIEEQKWIKNEVEITKHPYGTDLEMPIVEDNNKEWRWYLKRLDFSSYGSEQPATPITIDYSLSETDGAVLNIPLQFRARPAFRFGMDAEDNYQNDPIVLGEWTNISLTPVLIKLTKKNDRPESETATGPNYPVKYKFTINVANNKTVSDLTLNDPLSTLLKYNHNTANITDYPLNTITSAFHDNNQTIFTIAEINGSLQTEIKCEYEAHVPYYERDTNIPILDINTGNSRIIKENATLTYTYEGIQYSLTEDDVLIAKSIAIQKNKQRLSTSVNRVSGEDYYMPLDVVKYKWDIQISDYFNFTTLEINDKLSGGQSLQNGTFNLDYYQNGNQLLSLNSQEMPSLALENYEVPSLNGLTAEGTQIDINIGNMLTSSLGLDDLNLFGGRVDLENNVVDETLTLGKTYFEAEYNVEIDEEYKNTNLDNPTLAKLDIGDKLDNKVLLSSQNSNFRNGSLGSIVVDNSSEDIDVGYYSLEKSIYAIKKYRDGSIVFSDDNLDYETVDAGDQITYKITMTFSHKYIQDLQITDFVPPPIMTISDFNLAEQTVLINGIPSLNRFNIAEETTFPYSENQIAITTSEFSNSIKFDFGTYQTSADLDVKKIVIMYTLECHNKPTADELLLTNQAYTTFTNTTGHTLESDVFTKVVLNQPELGLKKTATRILSEGIHTSIGGTDSYGFGEVGDGGGFTLVGNEITVENASNIDYDAGILKPNDKMRIAVIIRNAGHNLAYNVKVRDILPEWCKLIVGSMRITDGVGNEIDVSDETDFFSDGGYLFQTINERDVIVITYDCEVKHDTEQYIEANSSHYNTCLIDEYTNISEDGINFVGTVANSQNLTDTCGFTSPSPTISKKILSTSEEFTNHTSSNDVSSNGRNTKATIGEIVEFEVNFTIPPLCKLTDARVRDRIYRQYTQTLQPTNGDSVEYNLENAGDLLFALSDKPNLKNEDYAGNDTYHNFGTIVNTGLENQTVSFKYKYIILDDTYLLYRTNVKRHIHSRAYLDYGTRTLNSNNTRISIREPELFITKTVINSTGYAGSPLTYQIKIENVDRSSENMYGLIANNVSFTDTMPDILTINSVIYPDGSIEEINGNTQTISYQPDDALEVGSSLTIMVNCTVKDTTNELNNILIGDSYPNTAKVSFTSIPSFDIDNHTIPNYDDTIKTTIGRIYNREDTVSFTPFPLVEMVIENQTYDHSVDNKVVGAIYDILKHNIKVRIPKGKTVLNKLVLDVSNLENFDETYHNLELDNLFNYSWVNPNGKLSSLEGFMMIMSRENDKIVFDFGNFEVDNEFLSDDVYSSEVEEYLEIDLFSKVSSNLSKSEEISITPKIYLDVNDAIVEKVESSVSYFIVEPTVDIKVEGVEMPYTVDDECVFDIVLSNSGEYASRGFNPKVKISELSKLFTDLELITDLDNNRVSNFVYNNGILSFDLDYLDLETVVVRVSGKLDSGIDGFPLTKHYSPYDGLDIENSFEISGNLEVSSQGDVVLNGEYLYNDDDVERVCLGKSVYQYPFDDDMFCVCFEDTLNFDYDYEDLILNGKWKLYNSKKGIYKIIVDFHARTRGADYNHVFGVKIPNIGKRIGKWDLYASLSGNKVNKVNQDVIDYFDISDNSLQTLNGLDMIPMFISSHKYLPNDEIGATAYSTKNTCNANNRTNEKKEWISPSSSRLVITITEPTMDLDFKIIPYIDVFHYNQSIMFYGSRNDSIFFGDVFSNEVKTGIPRCIMVPVDIVLGSDHRHLFSEIFPDFESWDLIVNGEFTNLDIISDIMNCEWVNNPVVDYQLKIKAVDYDIPDVKDISLVKNYHRKRQFLYPVEADLTGSIIASDDADLVIDENVVVSKVLLVNGEMCMLKENGEVVNGDIVMFSNVLDICTDGIHIYCLNDDRVIVTNNAEFSVNWTNICKIVCGNASLYGLDIEGKIYESAISSSATPFFQNGMLEIDGIIDFDVSDSVFGCLDDNKRVIAFDKNGNKFEEVFGNTKIRDVYCSGNKIFGLSKQKDVICVEISGDVMMNTTTLFSGVEKLSIVDMDSNNYFLSVLDYNGEVKTEGIIPNNININKMKNISKIFSYKNNLLGIKI
jgi:hypothetical protein